VNEPFVLYGQPGTGSVAIEAALTLAGAPFRCEDLSPRTRAPETYNPMAQLPALRLASGELITESAAILLWLAETYPEARLAPAPGSANRAQFLRWMSFVSAAIYAHYWLLDTPSRAHADPAAQAELAETLEARIAQNWGVMEANLTPGTYLVGEEVSVLDLYVTVVSRWTPRQALHETIAPRIGAVVRRVEADARLADLWARRFPLKQGA
jgi:GST-like protein